MSDLVTKYNIPAPRYTSYPTLPFWENNIDEKAWKAQLNKAFKESQESGISIYIHLPYCESLCTYCACNTRITVNHKVEKPYIDALLQEWELYLEQFEGSPLIKEIHLGGGTPTFFSPTHLHLLISELLKNCRIASDCDFSFEGHPNNTTAEHLKTLHDLGFRRASFGIQDFNPDIQEVINRFQSFEITEECVHLARGIGYTSVNFDLVYGLPFQGINSIEDTIEKVIALRPDRIAFYSYAHVPWLRPGQRKYSEKDLPRDSEKRKLYELGRKMFLKAGYKDVGMDHFALPSDSLYQAYKNKTLHRNFMGYTSSFTGMLIGLGCSAISDTWNCFSQNIKTVEEYISAVNEGRFPLTKGHLLDSDDLRVRQHILNLMCRNETSLDNNTETSERLNGLALDGLVKISSNAVHVTEKGRQFIRNICLAYDARYWQKQPENKMFSSTA